MTKRKILFALIFLLLAIVSSLGIYFYTKENINNTHLQSIPVRKEPSQNSNKLTDPQKPKAQIMSAEIDINGGILQGKDHRGQWIVVNIPPGALRQSTKLDLTLEESSYKVISGTKSPLVFKIMPDISFEEPLDITIFYEKKYDSDQIRTIVPYLVKEDEKLASATLKNISKDKNIFQMITFHGGRYSWVYVTK